MKSVDYFTALIWAVVTPIYLPLLAVGFIAGLLIERNAHCVTRAALRRAACGFCELASVKPVFDWHRTRARELAHRTLDDLGIQVVGTPYEVKGK